MNKQEMYLKAIESDKQAFQAFIKRRGYIENLGQPELKIFSEKVMNSELDWVIKCDLCEKYETMLINL